MDIDNVINILLAYIRSWINHSLTSYLIFWSHSIHVVTTNQGRESITRGLPRPQAQVTASIFTTAPSIQSGDYISECVMSSDGCLQSIQRNNHQNKLISRLLQITNIQKELAFIIIIISLSQVFSPGGGGGEKKTWENHDSSKPSFSSPFSFLFFFFLFFLFFLLWRLFRTENPPIPRNPNTQPKQIKKRVPPRGEPRGKGPLVKEIQNHIKPLKRIRNIMVVNKPPPSNNPHIIKVPWRRPVIRRKENEEKEICKPRPGTFRVSCSSKLCNVGVDSKRIRRTEDKIKKKKNGRDQKMRVVGCLH